MASILPNTHTHMSTDSLREVCREGVSVGCTRTEDWQKPVSQVYTHTCTAPTWPMAKKRMLCVAVMRAQTEVRPSIHQQTFRLALSLARSLVRGDRSAPKHFNKRGKNWSQSSSSSNSILSIMIIIVIVFVVGNQSSVLTSFLSFLARALSRERKDERRR